jgi:hypothetical protein
MTMPVQTNKQCDAGLESETLDKHCYDSDSEPGLDTGLFEASQYTLMH